jgi:hypothetical protein
MCVQRACTPGAPRPRRPDAPPPRRAPAARPQSRTLNKVPTKPEDLPTWNYDGSSTGQAPGDDSEVYLVPRAIFRDPFRGGDNILVMCDCYEPPRVKPDGTVRARRRGRAGSALCACLRVSAGRPRFIPCQSRARARCPTIH